jgi:putative flippase GtrA
MPSAQTLRTLFRYILTGGSAAVVDVSVFAALHRAGVPIAVAATCSFCVAAMVNYTLTSIFVFRKPLSPRGFVMFFGVALLGMSINVGVTVAGSALTPLGPILSKVAGIGTAFLLNFWLNSTFVFADRRRLPRALRWVVPGAAAPDPSRADETAPQRV